MHRILAVGCLALVAAAQVRTEKSYGQPETPVIVAYVLAALQHGDLSTARSFVARYRQMKGDTPEALEALSWLARGEAAAGNLDQANQDAEQIKHAAQTALATRKLDAEPHLPLALGAAYEVEADILTRENKRSEALTMLRSAMTTWRGTSLVGRLQKNINLLTLEGKPMPQLRTTDWLGTKPANPNFWRGKPLLLFFWAHWCADCKAEAPIISNLAAEFEPKGLVVLAPTRLYGYTAQDDHAPVAEERAFIERVFEKYYASIPNVKVPFDSGNFDRFGASTTPTIVLVDSHSIVRLYHPGVMDQDLLRAALARLTR